jgi:Mor family transcriptional regulator
MAGVKTIFPKGESLRQAVRWLAEIHSYDLADIEEACQRYDLSPNEEEFMIRHFLHADQRKKA